MIQDATFIHSLAMLLPILPGEVRQRPEEVKMAYGRRKAENPFLDTNSIQLWNVTMI